MTHLFDLWTALIPTVDVQPIWQNETYISLAYLNLWFHNATGTHMNIYIITDWLLFQGYVYLSGICLIVLRLPYVLIHTTDRHSLKECRSVYYYLDIITLLLP